MQTFERPADEWIPPARIAHPGRSAPRRTRVSPLGVIAPQSLVIGDLTLDSGRRFGPITVAFETYGTLSALRDNAVLVCHPLHLDAHAAGNAADDGRLGWWEAMIGPGKPLDTDCFFVICANVLGGCGGTTGPAALDPATGRPYAASFPAITVNDIVRAQRPLLGHLGIPALHAVIGGGFGGAQALSWSLQFPDRVRHTVAVAIHHRTPAYVLAMHSAMRQAIAADADWRGGEYYDGPRPVRGVATARMVEAAACAGPAYLAARYGRLRHEDDTGSREEFSIEYQLRREAGALARRFDANSYLALTRAFDAFAITAGSGEYHASFGWALCRYLFISYDSDPWFPPCGTRTLAAAARANGLDVTWLEAESPHGHESYLCERAQQGNAIARFLARA